MKAVGKSVIEFIFNFIRCYQKQNPIIYK